MLSPPVNTVPPVKAGTLQVYLNHNTQDSDLHISQLSTSSGSNQEICDQEVRNITRTHAPSETSTLVMSPRPGSRSTIDYSTQRDPDQPSYSPP